MNQTEIINNSILRANFSYNQPQNTFFMNTFQQMDNFFDTKLPINTLNEKLNCEAKEYNSKIFGFAPEKSSGCSETLSICANAEDDNLNNDYETSTTSKSDSDYPLLNKVLKEIKSTPLDDLLEEWWVSKEIKDPVKNSEKIRFKNTKTAEQLAALQSTIVDFPFKFPKKERIRFAKKIGLDEVQVYKWYYDNNPNKRGRRGAKNALDTFDTFSF